ncbi:MAG: YdcF family protein [Clostridia bacterium]
MKLSQIPIEHMTDEQIDKIVYEGIENNNQEALCGVVFGNYRFQDLRVQKAVELYKAGRIKKLLFLGGAGGISNEEHIPETEASCMKKLALTLGVKEQDIFLEEQSNNSIENCIQSMPILKQIYPKGNIDKLLLISSEFHLKRCLATFLKQDEEKKIQYILVPVRDGFSDRTNWFLSDTSWNTGRSLATFEAKALIQYAKEGKIEDLEVFI